MTKVKPVPPFLPYSEPIPPELGQKPSGWAKAGGRKKLAPGEYRVDALRAVRNWLRWNRPAIPRDIVSVSWPAVEWGRGNYTVIWDMHNKGVADDREVTLVHLLHKPEQWGDVQVGRIYVMMGRDLGGRRKISRSVSRTFEPHWMDTFLVEDAITPQDTTRRRIRKVR